MREEILRISKMVQEGKITPEEATELIDAMTAGEKAAAEEPRREKTGGGSGSRDPFDKAFERIDKVTREAFEKVNWPDIQEKIKAGAQRIKTEMEQIGKGEWKFSFGGHRDTKEQEIALSITPGKSFRAEVGSGDIKVVGGAADPKIKAAADVRGRDDEELRNRVASWAMMVEDSGGDAVLRLPGQAAGTASVDLEIHLPEGVPIELKSSSGDISVKGTKASVRVQGGSGDVEIEGAADRVNIQAYSGDVSVTGTDASQITIESRSGDIALKVCKANINVRTMSGDIEMLDVSGPSAAMETVSGDTSVKFSEPVTGHTSARSVNGDIDIAVPDGSSCRVSLSALSGELACELQLQDEIRAGKRLTGQLGDGQGTIDASTVSGDVTLEMRAAN